MSRIQCTIVCFVVLVFATTTGIAQVKNGCPSGSPPAGQTYAYDRPAGTAPFTLENEEDGTPDELLATSEFWTAGAVPNLGVCLIGNDPDADGTPDEFWHATAAAPTRSAFSLVAHQSGTKWDELIVQLSNNSFLNIHSQVGIKVLGDTAIPATNTITCSEIRDSGGTHLKSLVWKDSDGSHFKRTGGQTGSANSAPCVPGGANDLNALPGAPTLARGPSVAGPDYYYAAFFPPVYASLVIQNVEKSVPVGNIPLMSDWLLGIFVMLVLLLASWMITRRGRRRAMTEEA